MAKDRNRRAAKAAPIRGYNRETLPRWSSRFLTLEVFARVLADATIVNACYLSALILRFVIEPVGDGSPQAQLSTAFQIYLSHFGLLTLLALWIYAAHGIYGRRRLYRGRFKIPVIFQAVTLTFVAFGFLQYVGMAKGWLLPTPRVAMALGWAFTCVATIGARLWASLWSVVLRREKPLRPEQNRKGPIRRVLVIGGAGYIGSILCRYLLAAGYNVRVLDALLYGKDSLVELEGHPRFELMRGDSRDVSAVVAAVLDVDAVVHLGELVGDPACALDERLTLEINYSATRMLAEVAWGYGIKRFLYASSCSVYGATEQIVDERSDLNPVSLYARAKVGCEKALAEIGGEDFSPVILRLATVFGLSHRPRFDLVVNLLTAQAASGADVTVFGGTQYRPFVHVTDVSRAILACIEAPLETVRRQTFNVGSDAQNYSLREVGELICSLVPEAKRVSLLAGEDRRNYCVSFGKITRELGFECETSLEAGVLELAQALRSGVVEDYTSARHSNHKTLSDPAGEPVIKRRKADDWMLQIQQRASIER